MCNLRCDDVWQSINALMLLLSGWHICSVCQKASHYMCYTCTYSLCMGCTKDADYVCIRGNKGFCTICMKTIMLIENKDKMNSESVQTVVSLRIPCPYRSDFFQLTFHFCFLLCCSTLLEQLGTAFDDKAKKFYYSKPWSNSHLLLIKYFLKDTCNIKLIFDFLTQKASCICFVTSFQWALT